MYAATELPALAGTEFSAAGGGARLLSLSLLHAAKPIADTTSAADSRPICLTLDLMLGPSVERARKRRRKVGERRIEGTGILTNPIGKRQTASGSISRLAADLQRVHLPRENA